MQDDLSLFASSEDVAKALNGKTPSGKMPEEMKRLMNSDGKGNFTNWKSPEEQLEVVTTWKEVEQGLACPEISRQAPLQEYKLYNVWKKIWPIQ